MNSRFLWLLLPALWVLAPLSRAAEPEIAPEKSEPAKVEPVVSPANNPQPPLELRAPEPPAAAEKSTVLFSAGFGYRNTNWNHWEDPDNTQVNYSVDKTNNSIVEGDFALPVIGLRLGFNLMPDGGGLNKLQQYAGYLGFKGLSLAAEAGNFSGHAHYSGSLAPGQSPDVDFKQTYRFTELDYTFDSKELPLLIGLRYTQWNLPAEIALLGPDKTSGPTVFDPTFKTNFYSVLGGMDLFKTDFVRQGPEVLTPGWGVMFKFLGGVGFGTSHIDDLAVTAAQAVFHKTLTQQDPGVFTLHISGQLGPKYVFSVGRFKGVIGAGYDWNLLMLINTSTRATASTEVQPVAYPNFTYQGWIVRTYATF